jgi:hypothetical protein
MLMQVALGTTLPIHFHTGKTTYHPPQTMTLFSSFSKGEMLPGTPKIGAYSVLRANLPPPY